MSQYFNKKQTNARMSTPTLAWIGRQHKNINIQSRLSEVNQSIRDKAEYGNAVHREISDSKRTVNELEQKVDKQIQVYQRQTNELRQKIQNISKRMKEAQTYHKINKQKISQRIKQLKLKSQIELLRHKYASQNNLTEVYQYFQKMVTIVKTDQSIKDPNLTKKIKEFDKKLNQQIPIIKEQLSTDGLESQTYLQSIADKLQKKIMEFKKKMVELEHVDNQNLKLMNENILKAKVDIQEQLKNQRQARQDNKQKILMLLESKVQKQQSQRK